jgi:hypothetical protein
MTVGLRNAAGNYFSLPNGIWESVMAMGPGLAWGVGPSYREGFSVHIADTFPSVGSSLDEESAQLFGKVCTRLAQVLLQRFEAWLKIEGNTEDVLLTMHVAMDDPRAVLRRDQCVAIANLGEWALTSGGITYGH